MRRMLIASLTGHSRRLVAGLIAIVLSVTFLSVVLIVMDSAKEGVTRAVAEQYAATDMVVSETTDREAAKAISEVDGVTATAQLFNGVGEITLPDDRKLSQSVGTVPTAEELRWQRVSEGELPSSADQVAVSATLAEEYDVGVGDTLQVAGYGTDPTKAEVVGVVESDSLSGGAGVLIPEKLMNQAELGYPQEILVKGQPDSSAVSEAAGGSAKVSTAEEKVDESLEAFTAGVNVIGGLLLGFVAIALFVATLVVANTFTIVIAQRSRELALFRCVGASQSQVFRVVVIEALVLGVVGSILGLLAGFGLAQAGLRVLQNYMENVPVTSVALTPTAVLISIIVGTVITLFAALRPAARATGVPPLAALQPEGVVPLKSKKGTVRLVFGAILLGLGGLLLAMSALAGENPTTGVALGAGGGILSFIGVLWFGPVLVPAMVRLLGLATRGIGVPGKVSVDNAVRNPRRTATTASALLIGVTLISLLTIGAATAQRTSEEAMAEQYPVDVSVQPGDAGMGFLPSTEDGSIPEPDSLPGEVEGAVSEIEGVEQVTTANGVGASLAEESDPDLPTGPAFSVAAVNPDEMGEVLRDSDAYEAIQAGSILLDSGTASENNVSDGQEVVVNTQGGKTTMTVQVTKLPPEVPPALVLPEDMEKIAGSDPVTVAVWARASDDADLSKVTEGIQQISEIAPDAETSGSLLMRSTLQQVIDALLLTAIVLLAMAVLIAFVGVWNTLSLSVLERVRENSLLRALGLTRGQLRASLAVEAALIAGAAVVIGLLLGVVYGYVGVRSILGAVPNVDQIPLVIPWGRVGIAVVVALVSGVLASVLPARGAARTPPAGNL